MKTSAKTTAKALELRKQARRAKSNLQKAEVESARIRAMFDADRERLLRRYAVVSINAPL